ncbi:hypothetical protein TGAM01_v203957 [Trichoderma gamsii]|uniref:LEA domain-containing protein n=1 Tax=Trichoderma gamsii TaxID=398673 RepID=A0A2P4ZRW6_9HYPO|nr:hypothetical protein TGAM01_v203957 [Trichoderma gamsii]PON27008.1 hypothetical protein TGAM01_v203957 [Trichoderma gamsii]
MPHQQSSPDSPNLPPSGGDRQGPPRRSSSHRLVMLPRTTEDSNNSNSQNGDKKKNPDIKIPKIQPVEQGEPLAELAQGLVGRFVDEFGNILDWDGTVLGSVEGDLPSMVGRPVSESGEILDNAGEVVGYVSENHTRPKLKDLEGGLRIDGDGNIYNKQGKVVGKMNPSTEEGEGSGQQPAHNESEGTKSQDNAGKAKEDTPGPSDVYLDVKSTHDGIQLIIRIPTVFRKG